MSKILFACFKNPLSNDFSIDNIKLLSKRLEPDNITFHDTQIIADEKEIIAIFNPNNSVKIEDHSVCLGNMIHPDQNWHEPNSRVPDGTYALFRSNVDCLEIISDMVATRTIWYYHDENCFISATSQRAIVFFLKSFQFNAKVIPWILATGTLGPGYSWDERIKMLEGDSALTLDRKTWQISVKNNPIIFKGEKCSLKEHQEELKDALIETFEPLKLDYNKWVLPLSGGYDSRAILCMLRNNDNLKCVTWGLEGSKTDKSNDAYIAKKLADYYKIEHKYFLTDLSTEPVETIFNRYLICGEGRVDDIDAYLDGFSIWKELFESGIDGIIRGDEGFGAASVLTAVDIRRNMRLPLFSDFSNLNSVYEYGIPEQEFPAWLNRKDDESLEAWRDRLYYKYEMPIAFAALNDLKLSFVEVINPLFIKENSVSCKKFTR